MAAITEYCKIVGLLMYAVIDSENKKNLQTAGSLKERIERDRLFQSKYV